MRILLSATLLCLSVAGPLGAQLLAKTWKDRAEYRLYDQILHEPASTEKVKLLLEWERLYPYSDFRQERLAIFVTVYDAAERAEETFTAAKALFESDPSNLLAARALCYWAPRLKEPPADAAVMVKKAATQMLTRLDEVFARYASRRNLNSLFSGIETGKPATTEQVWNPRQKEERAEAERIARQALDWVSARESPRP